MKICFFHQPFDVDVSSGTDHARHQWHELMMAFGVTDCAVINETDDPFNPVNDSVSIIEFKRLADFVAKVGNENCVYLETGKHTPHHEANIGDKWLVIGGASGLLVTPEMTAITIETPVALYPRQAAAIVMENQCR